MNTSAQVPFSGQVTILREQRLPEQATPAGYSALIEGYGLAVPLPRTLCATGERHRIVERDGWRILTPRHVPKSTLAGHLGFALKYEGLDLAILKRLFRATGPDPIRALVQASPTGSYSRRTWFLYEWLAVDLSSDRIAQAAADCHRRCPTCKAGTPLGGRFCW